MGEDVRHDRVPREHQPLGLIGRQQSAQVLVRLRDRPSFGVVDAVAVPLQRKPRVGRDLVLKAVRDFHSVQNLICLLHKIREFCRAVAAVHGPQQNILCHRRQRHAEAWDAEEDVLEPRLALDLNGAQVAAEVLVPAQ